jgi:hypothetical protein
MRRSRIRRTIISSDERDLPDDVRSEIEKNQKYRELQDRTVFVRRVVALKRYETPAPGSRERCVVRVRKRIEWMQEQEAEKSSELDFAGQPAFSLRYGLAAAVAAVLAIQAFILGQPPSQSPTHVGASTMGPALANDDDNNESHFIPLPPGPNFRDMAPLFKNSISHPLNTSYDFAFTNPAIREIEFVK